MSIWFTNSSAEKIFNAGERMDGLPLGNIIPDDVEDYHAYLFESRVEEGGRSMGSHVIRAQNSEGVVFWVEMEMEKKEYEGELLHVALVKVYK